MSMIPHSDQKLSKPRAAKQAMAQECDVNNIVARASRLGVIPQARANPPQYVDLTGVKNLSLHEALNITAAAKSAFALLPAKVRAACKNDLRDFVDLVSNPKRREEAEQLGLLKAKTPPITADKKPDTAPKPDDKKQDSK